MLFHFFETHGSVFVWFGVVWYVYLSSWLAACPSLYVLASVKFD